MSDFKVRVGEILATSKNTDEAFDRIVYLLQQVFGRSDDPRTPSEIRRTEAAKEEFFFCDIVSPYASVKVSDSVMEERFKEWLEGRKELKTNRP